MGTSAGASPAAEVGEEMQSFVILLDKVIDIYTWIVIASAIMSWLVAFGVVNTRNQFIRLIVDILFRLTEPVLRPIRNIMPNLGGVDISPVILLLALFFIRNLMWEYLVPALTH
jgi:YggT family protein